MRICVSVLLLGLVLSGCHVHRLPKPLAEIARAPLPAFKHVFVVVEENENYADVIGNTRDMPYLNTLAAKFGLADPNKPEVKGGGLRQ